MEAWPCLLKQEAGVDDYLEMSSRRVDHRMGELQEGAPPNLETDKEQKELLTPGVCGMRKVQPFNGHSDVIKKCVMSDL